MPLSHVAIGDTITAGLLNQLIDQSNQPYATYAALTAVTGSNIGQRAYVNADPTASNNGSYTWNGTVWYPDSSFTFATLTTAKSIPTSTQSTLPLDTVNGSSGFAALSAGRVVIPQSGIYLAYIEVLWPANANATSSTFSIGPSSSGGTVLVGGQDSTISGASTSTWRQSASFQIFASAGDTLCPITTQSTGATLSVTSAFMRLTKIA